MAYHRLSATQASVTVASTTLWIVVSSVILGNAHVTKPSHLNQLTQVTAHAVQELLLAYCCDTLLRYCYHPLC